MVLSKTYVRWRLVGAGWGPKTLIPGEEAREVAAEALKTQPNAVRTLNGVGKGSVLLRCL